MKGNKEAKGEKQGGQRGGGRWRKDGEGTLRVRRKEEEEGKGGRKKEEEGGKGGSRRREEKGGGSGLLFTRSVAFFSLLR